MESPPLPWASLNCWGCPGAFRALAVASIASKIAEIETRKIESAIGSIEARRKLFRSFFICWSDLGLHHARERETGGMIHAKNGQGRAFSRTARNIFRTNSDTACRAAAWAEAGELHNTARFCKMLIFGKRS